MARHPRPKCRWNVELMTADMGLRGWSTSHVAEKAGKSYKTIDRFLTGEVQTAKTAKAIAGALGRSPSRYLLSVEVAA